MWLGLSHGLWPCEPPAISKSGQRHSQPLSSGWDAGSPQLRAGTATRGYPLHFQYTGKCDNSHCRCLTLICCLCTRSEENNHNFIAETGLCYGVMSLAPIQWSRPGEMQSCKQWALQWDVSIHVQSSVSWQKAQAVGAHVLYFSVEHSVKEVLVQTLLSQLGRGIL